MNIKATIILKYACLIFISIFLFACQGNVQENKDCSKCADEIYKEVSDTSLAKGVLEYQKFLLEKFGESSVKGLDYEAYHLQIHDTNGFSKSVKLAHKNGIYSIAVKCISLNEILPNCKDYEIVIDWEEWKEFERMIYEFNFWTEEEFKTEKNVLDGCGYLLEGNRPQAKMCNKKTYKLVARGSPRYDKIAAMCEYIFLYESELEFRYEQRNMIKYKDKPL